MAAVLVRQALRGEARYLVEDLGTRLSGSAHHSGSESVRGSSESEKTNEGDTRANGEADSDITEKSFLLRSCQIHTTYK